MYAQSSIEQKYQSTLARIRIPKTHTHTINLQSWHLFLWMLSKVCKCIRHICIFLSRLCVKRPMWKVIRVAIIDIRTFGAIDIRAFESLDLMQAYCDIQKHEVFTSRFPLVYRCQNPFYESHLFVAVRIFKRVSWLHIDSVTCSSVTKEWLSPRSRSRSRSRSRDIQCLGLDQLCLFWCLLCLVQAWEPNFLSIPSVWSIRVQMACCERFCRRAMCCFVLVPVYMHIHIHMYICMYVYIYIYVSIHTYRCTFPVLTMSSRSSLWGKTLVENSMLFSSNLCM